MKTSFHMKSFALSLTLIMRLGATQKWSIDYTIVPEYPIDVEDSQHYPDLKYVLLICSFFLISNVVSTN